MLDWKTLTGGTKELALRQHRAEILAYYEQNGEQAAREKYHIIKDLTWHHFLNSRQVKIGKLTKVDRAIARAEITEQGLRDVSREVKDLRDQYSRFVPFLASELTRKFLVPLLSGSIELPPELEYKPKPDPLSLADLKGKLEK